MMIEVEIGFLICYRKGPFRSDSRATIAETDAETDAETNAEILLLVLLRASNATVLLFIEAERL